MMSIGDKDPPPYHVRASNWKVLPSRGTEAHSVLLLKTLFALYGGEYIVLEVGILLEVRVNWVG